MDWTTRTCCVDTVQCYYYYYYRITSPKKFLFSSEQDYAEKNC